MSSYAFTQIEVFTPGRLTYHLLGLAWTAPPGVAGTAAWPLSRCWIPGPPGYGIPGAGCLFPNYDDLLLLAALLMGLGLLLWYLTDPVARGCPPRQRLWRSTVLAVRVMTYYSTAVFTWCIVLFGAVPTWDQSVVWAASPTWSYPAPTWDPITNTCLVPFPGHTSLWPSCSFPNFAECLVASLLLAALASSAVARWRSVPGPPVGFEEYTVDRYERAIRGFGDRRALYLLGIALASLVTEGIFLHARPPVSFEGAVLQPLTILWLLPVPMLTASLVAQSLWFRRGEFSLCSPVRAQPRAETPTVVFQLTSSGRNPGTVERSIRSVQHWTRRGPSRRFQPEIWLCLDEGSVEPSAPWLVRLRSGGAHVLWVPDGYQTPMGTTGKGRALQFAADERSRRWRNLEQVFVYFQDDETAVGEDTLLGIDRFVQEHGDAPCVGAGIILYPHRAEDLRPSQLAELFRTHDDLRLLMSLSTRRNWLGAYHGSHMIVRADVERAVGFDPGPDQTSEDFVFESQVRARFGGIFHVLRGFAYEQAPLGIRDQLRQRRRWITGWVRALRAVPLPIGRRLAVVYQLLLWGSGLVSLALVVVSAWVGFSALYPLSGAVAGIVWGNILVGLTNGYQLNRSYMRRVPVPSWRLSASFVVALVTEALAPWYALVTRRPMAFEVIAKDGVATVPRPTPRPPAQVRRTPGRTPPAVRTPHDTAAPSRTTPRLAPVPTSSRRRGPPRHAI